MKILGKLSSCFMPKSKYFTCFFHKSLNSVNREISTEPLLLADIEKSIAQEMHGIKFKKAKTIEEAKDYAINILGIKKYEVNDLEIANQFNLSTTRAFNKTRTHDIIPDEVDIGYIDKYISMSKNEYNNTPAATLFLRNGNQKVRLNQAYFENIDRRLEKLLENYRNFGQISKTKKGFEQINLVCSYRYNHSLNRYYKLYQEGKLTTKAKADFDSLLTIAQSEEASLLNRKISVIDIIRQHLGIDLSHLPPKEYEIEVRKALLNMQNKNKIALSTGRQRKAVGLDNCILHEEGHVWNNKTLGTDAIKNKTFTGDKETDIAYHQITPYAAKTPNEMIGEAISGILSGEKYSDEVYDIFKKYAGKMIDYSS